jgi:iron complex outermembrane receptor protein
MNRYLKFKDHFRGYRLARFVAALSAATLVLESVTQQAAAQQSASGTITGRVLNAENGKYLPRAQVSVEGTNLETLTDDYGFYEIRNVPVGPVKLVTKFTGQAPKTSTVTVNNGQTVTQDVSLGSNNSDGAMMLDPFKVESERFRTAQEIAINEERYSVNIKNVVSADQFGHIPSGNVGEFIKYLPGVELEYGGTYIAPTDAFGVSVRGFGAEDTAIYIDGVPIASASQASLTTQIGLDMMSINNASRVELIKVATPDMPMNSVGGQINLISKSAFEFAKPSFSWRAYVTVNSENPNPFEKIAGPTSKKVYAGQPGVELSYVFPINRKLGVSVTASTYSQVSQNRRFRPEWGTSAITGVDLRPFNNIPANQSVSLTNAQGAPSLANPFLNRISITDAPRTSTSYTASIKTDWKPLDGLSLSGTYQLSISKAKDAARRIQIRIQRPMSWDANSTISYPFLTTAQSQALGGNGASFNPSSSLDMNIDSRDKEGITHTGSLRAVYQKGPWDIFALASASTSRASFKDLENGHFSTVDVSASIGQIKFENIVDGNPGKVTIFDRNGAPFDYTDLSKWTTPTIQARSGKAESLDDVFNYKFDLKRQLDFLPWDFMKLAFKTGYLREETLKKKWGLGTGYRQTYAGTPLTVNDYLDTTYLGYNPGFGYAPQQWISTYRLYDIYAANPTVFNANSDSDKVNNYNSQNGQNKRIKEVKDAYYGQFEGSALKGRLNFIAGARVENSSRTGAGPQIDSKWNFLKNPDGTLYRNVSLLGGVGTVRFDQSTSPLFAQDATGTALRADLTAKKIAFPTTFSTISTSTLEGIMLQRKTLSPVKGESNGKPSYSINLAYDITPKLVGKLAYSRSNGKISLENATVGLLTGGTSFNISEADDPNAIPRGSITVANPNLLPEISTNWDLGVTYYTDGGGKLGLSLYTKSIKNFAENITVTSGTPEFNEVLPSLGLDPADYDNWQLTTAENGVGTGKVQGYEVEAYQDLRFLPFLGEWGRRVNLFATYSHSHRSETNTTRISARPAATQLATGGINLSVKRVTLNVKATWRDVTLTQGNGNFVINGTTVQLGTYDPSVTKVDASLDWQFAKNYGAFISGRNIFATGLRKERMDQAGIYPAYAQWDDLREFGVEVTFGIRGSF